MIFQFEKFEWKVFHYLANNMGWQFYELRFYKKETSNQGLTVFPYIDKFLSKFSFFLDWYRLIFLYENENIADNITLYAVNFIFILILFVIEIGTEKSWICKPSLTLAIGRPYAKIFIHFRQIDGDFAGNLVEMRKW